MRILRGHNWVVSELRFHPNGRMLLSNSWREGKTGVWNAWSGEHLLWQDGCPSRFSRDGTRHAFCDVDTAGIWNVSAGDAQILPPCYESSTVPSNFSPTARMDSCWHQRVIEASIFGTPQVGSCYRSMPSRARIPFGSTRGPKRYGSQVGQDSTAISGHVQNLLSS